jgi:uncharacterized membrane protein
MENRNEQDRTLKDLSPNVAALLCYVAGWVSGIVFLVIEQKNRFVRFHALQSIIVFGALTVAGAILGYVPFAGPAFSGLVTVSGFILWIILMVKANSGELFKIPWAGNLAEKLMGESMGPYAKSSPVKDNGNDAALPAALATPASLKATKHDAFRARYYSYGARAGRIVGSSLAIAWSLALIIFFNFYNQYIAYYQPVQMDGNTYWYIQTLVTSDFNSWLPLLTTTLALSIIGHALLIAFDKYVLRQSVLIIMDVFGLATVVTLLSIYPFDFNVIPNTDAAWGAQIGATVTLILVAVGFGIGALARFIGLIVNLVEGKY